MPDVFSRVAYYRVRSEECLRLAGIVADKDVSRQYRNLAAQNRSLVETELKLAETVERVRRGLDGEEVQ